MDKFLDYKQKAAESMKQIQAFLEKYWAYIVLGIVILICLIVYFTAFFRRVPRALSGIRTMAKIVNPAPLIENNEVMNGGFRLCDFYIASSHRSYLPYSQYWDYSSPDTIQSVLEAGARYIELDVFPNNFCLDSPPVVFNGIEAGLYNWTTKICFEKCIEVVRYVAFNSSLRNNSDPLFLCININCDYNYRLLDKIADILFRNLGNRMLDTKYSWRENNLAQTPIKELIGKVIIISNNTWEQSPMEELVNFSWQMSFLRNMNHDQLQNTFDQVELRNYNKFNLTRVYPAFTERKTQNYNPVMSWLAGCQFVCMNYQSDDQFMRLYIDKFKDASLILKPETLRYKPVVYKEPIPQTPAVDMAPRVKATPFYTITY